MRTSRGRALDRTADTTTYEIFSEIPDAGTCRNDYYITHAVDTARADAARREHGIIPRLRDFVVQVTLVKRFEQHEFYDDAGNRHVHRYVGWAHIHGEQCIIR